LVYAGAASSDFFIRGIILWGYMLRMGLFFINVFLFVTKPPAILVFSFTYGWAMFLFRPSDKAVISWFGLSLIILATKGPWV